jgi:N-acetylglutamate synthase-like GNAT family acetyltransferase
VIRRATNDDIPAINAILNHPSIYPAATLGVDVGALDVTDAMENIHVLLIEEGAGGCLILDPYNHLTLELHTCILPDFRGKLAEVVAEEVLRFAFGQLAAARIFTRIHVTNKGADLFARQMGFVRISDGHELRGYEMTVNRWPSQDKHLAECAIPEMEALVPDPHFGKIAGAFALMANNGFLGNGVALYNEHARLHGYPRMDVPTLDSVLVGGLRIHFSERNNPRVEVMSCQPYQ